MTFPYQPFINLLVYRLVHLDILKIEIQLTVFINIEDNSNLLNIRLFEIQVCS